jgi:diphthine synthase
MSLVLIGLGLFDEKDLTMRAIEESKKADKLYIELYTSKWYGSIENLEKIIGKKVVELKRKDLEENSNVIINESKTQNIVIFIQGDPLVQTVHIALLYEAKLLGIKTKVVHNASIISALGETGFHLNKFGPFVTIPFPERTKGKLPDSVFQTIKENKKRGLHTLCLLDVIVEENRYMTVNEGLEVLLKGKVIKKDEKAIILTKVGAEDSLVLYHNLSNIMKQNISDIPAAIVVPGKLYFTENEYLNSLNTNK